MNVLILVNGAGGHRPFFSRVGRLLVSRGHSVTYAVDSHYTDVMYPGSSLDGDVHYFSDYFRLHRGHARIPDRMRSSNLWLGMYPDTDRLNHPSGARSIPPERRTGAYNRDLLAALTAFFWSLFERHSFDRIVYEGVSNAFSYVAYLVGLERGATYVGFSGSRLPSRFEVSTSQFHRDLRLPEVYRGLRSGTLSAPDSLRTEARKYLETFFESLPDYTAASNRLPSNPFVRYARKDSLLRVARALKYRVTQSDDLVYAFQVPDAFVLYPLYMAYEVRRSLRVRWLKQRVYRQPDPSQRYFVYPMQFHPESSTSVNAPYYVDELVLIRNISISLPVDYFLYVKDHQHVVAGRQSSEFYKEVARIPNVVLIDPSVNSKRLIAGSQGVIAGTSTMGYEAIILGKPVFVFGTAFYDFHPLCVRLRSYWTAFDELRRADQLSATKDELFDFVLAYYLCTYPGLYDLEPNLDNQELIGRISDLIEAPPLVSPEATRAGTERAQQRPTHALE